MELSEYCVLEDLLGRFKELKDIRAKKNKLFKDIIPLKESLIDVSMRFFELEKGLKVKKSFVFCSHFDKDFYEVSRSHVETIRGETNTAFKVPLLHFKKIHNMIGEDSDGFFDKHPSEPIAMTLSLLDNALLLFKGMENKRKEANEMEEFILQKEEEMAEEAEEILKFRGEYMEGLVRLYEFKLQKEPFVFELFFFDRKTEVTYKVTNASSDRILPHFEKMETFPN